MDDHTKESEWSKGQDGVSYLNWFYKDMQSSEDNSSYVNILYDIFWFAFKVLFIAPYLKKFITKLDLYVYKMQHFTEI